MFYIHCLIILTAILLWDQCRKELKWAKFRRSNLTNEDDIDAHTESKWLTWTERPEIFNCFDIRWHSYFSNAVYTYCNENNFRGSNSHLSENSQVMFFSRTRANFLFKILRLNIWTFNLPATPNNWSNFSNRCSIGEWSHHTKCLRLFDYSEVWNGYTYPLYYTEKWKLILTLPSLAFPLTSINLTDHCTQAGIKSISPFSDCFWRTALTQQLFT